MANAVEENVRLELARELVKQLEAGQSADAGHTIQKLADPSENQLFQEVGRLTRDLHDAINGFLLDARISELAEREIPDASERLSYVITMTENAANTSLGAVEASLPLADELHGKARALATDWDRFRGRKLAVDEFRVLSQKIENFLYISGEHSEQLQSKLSEVLMAQGFQDLTGQVIRQVITLIHDVEEKLVRLVRISGGLESAPDTQQVAVLEGPAVPGVDQGDQVNGQDDVDDLLSSLGF